MSIFVYERDDVVESMTTDVGCPVGVILKARRAADVDGAAYDEVAGICTKVADILFRGNSFTKCAQSLIAYLVNAGRRG